MRTARLASASTTAVYSLGRCLALGKPIISASIRRAR